MVQWDASDYQRNSSTQQAWARELIAKLALQGSERILDVGCGDGKVSAEIARLVPDGFVVGVDKSEDMVRFAAEAFRSESRPNLRFAVADASSLEFEHEFDIIFSNATLHWIIDHRLALRGIACALKSGGRCLLQMGGRGNAARFFDAALQSPAVRGKWGHYYEDLAFPYGFYGPEEYLPWLAEAGLEPVRVELLSRDMVYAGADGLAGWMRTTWMPYTHRIPEQERERFIAESVQAYIQRYPPDDDGRVHVAMVRLEVEAAI